MMHRFNTPYHLKSTILFLALCCNNGITVSNWLSVFFWGHNCVETCIIHAGNLWYFPKFSNFYFSNFFFFQAFLLLGPALQFFTFILNQFKLFYKAIILTSANWSKFPPKQEKKLGIEDIPGKLLTYFLFIKIQTWFNSIQICYISVTLKFYNFYNNNEKSFLTKHDIFTAHYVNMAFSQHNNGSELQCMKTDDMML